VDDFDKKNMLISIVNPASIESPESPITLTITRNQAKIMMSILGRLSKSQINEFIHASSMTNFYKMGTFDDVVVMDNHRTMFEKLVGILNAEQH